MGQLTAGGGVYLPDYSVRQLTDLQIIKVTNINGCTHITQKNMKKTTVIIGQIKSLISCALKEKLGTTKEENF